MLLGLAIMLAFASLGLFWAPAMAMLSDASEDARLDQAIAFAISNLAWVVGHVVGAGAGGGLADLTSDTVPYALLAVICTITFAAVTALARRTSAGSAAAG